jgi:hypothetical protein
LRPRWKSANRTLSAPGCRVSRTVHPGIHTMLESAVPTRSRRNVLRGATCQFAKTFGSTSAVL